MRVEYNRVTRLSRTIAISRVLAFTALSFLHNCTVTANSARCTSTLQRAAKDHASSMHKERYPAVTNDVINMKFNMSNLLLSCVYRERVCDAAATDDDEWSARSEVTHASLIRHRMAEMAWAMAHMADGSWACGPTCSGPPPQTSLRTHYCMLCVGYLP